eukprot:g16000.t1
MSPQYNRRYAFIHDEGFIVRARLRAFSARTRTVVEAAQTLSGKGRAPNSAAKLEAARSNLTFCLLTLLDLKRISFGPGPALTDESTSSTTRRKSESKKPVGADVQYVTWKLVEHAEREENRHTKERRALKQRQREHREPAHDDADQGPHVPNAGADSGFAVGGASSAGDVVVAGSAYGKAAKGHVGGNPDLGGGAVAAGGGGASAAEVPGASAAAAPGYSSSLSTPSTGQAAGNLQPARHFMTLQHRAPKRVPAKKRRHHLNGGAVIGSGSAASAAEVPGASAAAAPGYSSSLSTPSTGQAAGTLQPARHFMTLQHRAPKRVPAKKRKPEDEPNAGTTRTLAGGAVAGDGIGTAKAEGGGGGSGVAGDGAMGAVAAARDGLIAGNVRCGVGVLGGGGDVTVNGGAAGGDDGFTGHGGDGAGESGLRSDLVMCGDYAAGGGRGAGIAEDGVGATAVDFQLPEVAQILQALLGRQTAGATSGAKGAGGAHTAHAATQQSENHLSGLESAGGGSESSGFVSGLVEGQEPGSNMQEPINNKAEDGDNRGGRDSQRFPSGPAAATGTSGVDDSPPRCNDDPAEGDAAAPAASASTAGTSDGAPSTSSVRVEGQQGMKTLKVGDPVEYRWGQQSEWYKCRLVLLQGEGTSREAELEFLPKKHRKTKGVRCFSGIVKVTELVQDGDLALPGTHKTWD